MWIAAVKRAQALLPRKAVDPMRSKPMAKQMTMTSDFAPAHGRRHGMSLLLAWFQNTAQSLADSIAWYQNYRESANELECLTDKELNDIGIARYDIPQIAAQSASEKIERR
jgi:uncharacterized protein YjiS (DUF1127 family)